MTNTEAIPSVAVELTTCPHCGKPLDFMSASEAAERLGVHRNMLSRWAAGGKIPGAKLVEEPGVPSGRRWLFPTHEIARMAKERRRSKASRPLTHTRARPEGGPR